MEDLVVKTEYLGGNQEIALITAKGYIDTVTVPEVEKALQGIIQGKKYKIIVDLKNIDYVSSAGWGAFVSEIKDLRDNKGDLVLINMSPDVYDVYELMEFSSILKAYSDIKEAVTHFGGEKIIKESFVDPSKGMVKGQSVFDKNKKNK
ncbi:MAG: STAS domain-containing protein [Spirochaetes bacterium]|nr:STAS domain-containing protein [Spirochaetota bacterium]